MILTSISWTIFPCLEWILCDHSCMIFEIHYWIQFALIWLRMSWHLSYHYLIYSLGFYLFVGIFCNFFNLFGSILDSIFGKSLKKSKLSYLKYSKIINKAICCDFLFGDSFLITFNGHTCDPSIQVLYFYLFVFSSYLFIYLKCVYYV